MLLKKHFPIYFITFFSKCKRFLQNLYIISLSIQRRDVMTVALEGSLAHYRKDLEQAGHLVVSLYDRTVPVDAVIYENDSIINMPEFSLGNSQNNAGVLMICAGHLPPETILGMLNQKSYGTGSILF